MGDMISGDLEPELKARIAELAKQWNVSEKEALSKILRELPKTNIVEWRKIFGPLPEGVLLAFATLFGYVVAYIYQVRFVSFWGIPIEFVDLGLVAVITGALVIVLAILFTIPMGIGVSWVLQMILTKVAPKRNDFLKRAFFVVRLPLVLGFLIIIGLQASSDGDSMARWKSEFLVTNTSPEMVVLYKSGDNLICAPFDRKTKKVYKRFTILSPDKTIVLSPQKVGPLSVVE